jgi:hypothetical protein
MMGTLLRFGQHEQIEKGNKMSLDAHVYISTNSKPEQALQELFDVNGIDIQVRLDPGIVDRPAYYARRDGYIVYSHIVSERMRNHFADEFGIVPTASLDFRLDHTEKEMSVQLELVENVLKLLSETDHDLALIFLDAVFILMRKSGQLLLNSGVGFWTPNNLMLVTLPYTLMDIPFL